MACHLAKSPSPSRLSKIEIAPLTIPLRSPQILRFQPSHHPSPHQILFPCPPAVPRLCHSQPQSPESTDNSFHCHSCCRAMNGGGAPTHLLLSRSIPFTSGTHGPRRDITAGLPLQEVRIVQQEPCRFLHVDVPLPPPRHRRIPTTPRSTHLASPSPSLHSMWNRRRGCHSGHMTTRRHRSYHLRTSAVARMSQLAGASATVAFMESREGER